MLVQNEWNQVKQTNEIKYTVISTSLKALLLHWVLYSMSENNQMQAYFKFLSVTNLLLPMC